MGGMGQVWAATHLVTGRAVALKLLNGTFPSRDAKRRFLKEAKLASLVNHPNVVNVHDFFELADGRPVMMMDVLQGETLRKKLAREQALPLHMAASILLPVVSAVGTAHACGVVHRDLKPENVFLCPAIGGRIDVRVLDFGIAKFMGGVEAFAEESDAITGTGGVLATAWYMSPEQGCGEKVDHRTDLWSLGVLMYELLSGSRPVEGDNYGQILKRLLSESITPLGVLVPELPADVLGLVDRMLQRRAAARPRDLREVAEVLGRYTNVMVPPFGAHEPEPPLPPDSSPSSVPHAVVELAQPSDPFAATELVGCDDSAPLSSPDTVVATPRWPRARRAFGASAVMLAISVLGGWSWWPREPTALPAPIVMTPPHVAAAVVVRPQPQPAAPVPETTGLEKSVTNIPSMRTPAGKRFPMVRARPLNGPSAYTPPPEAEPPAIAEPRLRTEPPAPAQYQPDHRVAGGAGIR
jgi:serine/threonine-protein kinase